MTYRVYFADGNQRLLEGSIPEIVRHITEVEPSRTERMRQIFKDNPEALRAFHVREPVEIVKIEPAPEYD